MNQQDTKPVRRPALTRSDLGKWQGKKFQSITDSAEVQYFARWGDKLISIEPNF